MWFLSLNLQPHGCNLTLTWTQSRKRSRISDVSSDYKELMWSICAGDNDLSLKPMYFIVKQNFYWKLREKVQYLMFENVSVFMAVENGDIGMLKSLGIKVELLSQSLNLWAHESVCGNTQESVCFVLIPKQGSFGKFPHQSHLEPIHPQSLGTDLQSRAIFSSIITIQKTSWLNE